MRYLPMILGAALVSVGLPTASGKAHAAMPVASPDRSAVPAALIEKAGCYYRHYGYYPHGTTGPTGTIDRPAITAGTVTPTAGASR
jgi:hypothetical protein